jgi:hypothetical protein
MAVKMKRYVVSLPPLMAEALYEYQDVSGDHNSPRCLRDLIRKALVSQGFLPRPSHRQRAEGANQ